MARAGSSSTPRPIREEAAALVERAAAAGYSAIVLTVDLPVLGYRQRDRLSAFDVGIAAAMGNFDERGARADARGPARPEPDLGRPRDDPELVEPAARAQGHPDRARTAGWPRNTAPTRSSSRTTGHVSSIASPAPVDVLEEVVRAVDGRSEVWVDGGVRRGLDIAIALALGARGVLVGRPILWALAAGGQSGVERALAILREEFEIALTLLGDADAGLDLPGSCRQGRPVTETADRLPVDEALVTAAAALTADAAVARHTRARRESSSVRTGCTTRRTPRSSATPSTTSSSGSSSRSSPPTRS